MEFKDLIMLIGAGLWTLFTAYLIYAMTKADNDLKQYKEDNRNTINSVDSKVIKVVSDLTTISQKQLEHEYNFVTEKHVREILKEEVKDIKADISTVKNNVSTILDSIQNLTIAIGIQNGIRETEMQKGVLGRPK